MINKMSIKLTNHHLMIQYNCLIQIPSQMLTISQSKNHSWIFRIQFQTLLITLNRLSILFILSMCICQVIQNRLLQPQNSITPTIPQSLIQKLLTLNKPLFLQLNTTNFIQHNRIITYKNPSLFETKQSGFKVINSGIFHSHVQMR